MKNQIYVLKNRLAGRFVTIFSFESEELCKARLSDPAAKFNFDELEVYHVGTFDIQTGRVEPCDPVQIIIPRNAPTVDEMVQEVK